VLDQNLSPRLVPALRDVYRGTTHVREHGLQSASDDEVWRFARERGCAILSKDADFLQMSFLFGPPPKVVWIRLGNCTSDRILDVLLASRERVAAFESDETAALLVLP
jgi:predicted nuclease of predicted toxin-antitoxin system